jgi:hypothetical protein
MEGLLLLLLLPATLCPVRPKKEGNKKKKPPFLD